MQAQAIMRRVVQADEAIAALRKQILDFKAPSIQELKRENGSLRARVAAAKVSLDKAEAGCMPDTKEIIDKNWTVRSPMFRADFNGRNPAVSTVDAPFTGHSRQAPTKNTDAAAQTKAAKASNPAKGKKEKKEKAAKKPKQAAPVAENVEPLSRLDLRVGRIVEVSRHPDAEKLYVEKVDIGEDEPRQILSGLVDHVPLSGMQDRLAIFLLNLKPAKMRGIESQGMIMCASGPDKVEVIEVPAGSAPGDHVVFDGYPRTPDARLNPKKKIWEAVAPDMAVGADGVARYKSVSVRIKDRGGDCTAPTARNCPIK